MADESNEYVDTYNDTGYEEEFEEVVAPPPPVLPNNRAARLFPQKEGYNLPITCF